MVTTAAGGGLDFDLRVEVPQVRHILGPIRLWQGEWHRDDNINTETAIGGRNAKSLYASMGVLFIASRESLA